MDFDLIKGLLGFLLIYPLAAIFFLVVLSPNILAAYFGWKLSEKKIKNPYLRIMTQAAVISIAGTPSLYMRTHHPSPIPAVWMLYLGSGRDRFTYGIFPILVVFILGASIACGICWFRKNKAKARC